MLFYFIKNIKFYKNSLNFIKNLQNYSWDIDNIFKKLSPTSPARMSYNIFASGSDTIKASVITGLGTRLQAFQNEDLQKLTNEGDFE